MKQISAALVRTLRSQTSAGVMACKQALLDSGGDLNAATELLRRRGSQVVEELEAREAREGVIAKYIDPGERFAAIVEVNCQTDFVARNDEFRSFCDKVAKSVALESSGDLERWRQEQAARLGEKVTISHVERMAAQENGMIGGYIHPGAKVGVLVEMAAVHHRTIVCDRFRTLVRDIALQIAAMRARVVSREDVDLVLIHGDEIQERPGADPKRSADFREHCLLDQEFVKASGISVKGQVALVAGQLGDAIGIRRFVRFEVGDVRFPKT